MRLTAIARNIRKILRQDTLFCGVDEEVELPGTTEASVVKPGYFLNEPWFEYNPEDKCIIVSNMEINRLTSLQVSRSHIRISFFSILPGETMMRMDI